MNEELLAASTLLVQSAALLVSHNGFISFFCNCPMLSQPSLRCTSRTPSYFNNTGSTSKGIMTRQFTRTNMQTCNNKNLDFNPNCQSEALKLIQNNIEDRIIFCTTKKLGTDNIRFLELRTEVPTSAYKPVAIYILSLYVSLPLDTRKKML
jgi:hypothetical protein